MGRKKGISTHRKSSRKKSYSKPRNVSTSVVSNDDNIPNSTLRNLIKSTNTTPVINEDVTGNHPHLLNINNVSNEDSPCSRLMSTNLKGRCIMPMLDVANDSHTTRLSKNCANDRDDVSVPNINKLRTPKKGNNNNDSISDIEMDNDSCSRTTKAMNSLKETNKVLKRRSIARRGTKVQINNIVHCKDGSSIHNKDAESSRTDSPLNKVVITNNIIMNDDASKCSSDSDDSSTDIPINKKKKFTKYSNYHTRRRSVRALNKFFKELGNTQYQSEILSSFLNESYMAPILRAANILSPQTILEHKLIVDQIMKQIGRCSQKLSERGRINQDQDSLRTNLVAAMVASPNVNIDDSLLRKNHILRMIHSNTDLSRSACKRLVNKAELRRNDLSVSETVSSWSIISNRKGYNTQQSKLNKELLEWILNHHHVVRSPQETILVKVPTPNGGKVLERVGKLLLEVSVRELHQDLMKDPPIGFKGAYSNEIPRKLLISERYLRNMLPPQLKSMTFADKQLCGCACCTITKMVHACLLKYRKKVLSLQSLSKSPMATRRSYNKIADLDEYKYALQHNNQLKVSHPREVLKTMTCQNVNHDTLPKWSCVMGRCQYCPTPFIPTFETSAETTLDNITYGDYTYHIKCRIHGILPKDDTVCKKCIDCIEKKHLTAPEPLTRRKEITMINTSISMFHKNVYLPYLRKYKYHSALVTLLSKNYCKKMRTESFQKNTNWLISEMDYAERLAKQLDGEIQSDHFGDNATLSIEGCTLQYHEKLSNYRRPAQRSKIYLDFHSHFADYSRQDAATTFEHISCMFEHHIQRHGPFPKSSVLLDHTDGCAKQYRCGNALYLLNVLSLSYNIVIDRAICAPGHGKSIIDGLNAVDKHYLRKVMRMSGSTRMDDIDSRMRCDTTHSFAEECARLCSLDKRKDSFLNKKLSKRFYHVHRSDDIKYSSINKTTKGWKKNTKEKGNGIQHHYNFRADPILGLGKIAVRRIPCSCDACVHQLSLPWELNKEFIKQPRYSSNNTERSLWPVLGELNNWILITIIDDNNDCIPEINNITKTVFKNTMQSRVQGMASIIEEGNYGAVSTCDDSAVSGYYICTFASTPYILQDSYINGSEKIQAGELVCDITWLNPVPMCKTMFSHAMKDDISLNSVIRVQHVVDDNVKYKLLDDITILPRSMRNRFQSLRNLNTIIIDNECHDNIVETIFARNHVDYQEDVEITDDSSVGNEMF